MKKFLLGLLTGFVLAGLAGVILVFALLRAGDRRTPVPEGSLLVVRLEGNLPELAPVTIPLPVFESQAPATVADLWMLLREAARDEHIKAVLIEPRGTGAGWAKLDELREGIRQFKKSGKPVYAYLRNPTAREYYLATAADKIFFNPEDILDLKGLRAELAFYKRTLDKLGVEMEVEHAGKYKNAADSYVRTEATPETREVVNSMLDQLFNHLVESIAAARKLDPARIRALIDEGPFIDEAALSAKLIDGLLYEDQVRTELQKQLKVTKLERLGFRDYLNSTAFGPESKASKIALIVGEGAITRGGGDSDPFGEDEGIRSTPFMRLLRQAADDPSIRAVILRVNSPGGDAIASDEILHEVKLLARKKPLVVSMSDVAASGGYYIAMTGDPVVAYPNTITGSIGVIYGKVNLKGLYDKLGVNTETILRGKNADFDSVAHPMNDAARQKLREGIGSTYRAFLERVAEGRKRKVGEIEPLAQGRVWMGAQAKGNGLVDALGGLDTAIELVRKKANIAAGDRIQLVPFPRKRSLLEQVFNSSESVMARLAPPSAEAAAAAAARRWSRELGLNSFDPALWGRGAMLAVPPFEFRIR